MAREWDVLNLEDVCVRGGLVRGPFGGSLRKSDFVRSGFQVYEQRHAIAGTWQGARYFVTAKKFESMKRFSVRPDDFIVSCSGTIGRIYRVETDGPPGIINQALLKITIDKDLVEPEYFRSYFEWNVFQDQILDSTQGGAMQNLVGMATFKKTPIVLPPINEQRRIAMSLRDCHELVTELERLITKKQAIKQGMMQELLTGRTRLPGFDAVWPQSRLGLLASGSRGAGLSKSVIKAGGATPCILYGELFTTYERVIPQALSFTDATGTVRSVFGQVLLPGSTTTVGTDLATASALLQADVLLGGDINVVSPRLDRLDPVWLALFLTSQRRQQIGEAAQGTTIIHLYVRDVLTLEIPVPPIEEQQAIAAVLNDAEQELAVVRACAAKAKMIKQGMMHALLTGRTRLPVAESPS